MNNHDVPPSLFKIRHASTADNILLSALGAETFYDSFAAENTPENMAAYLAASFSPEKQARELVDPASRFLILEAHGQPAGYARLRLGPAPAAVVALRPIEIVRFYARRAWIGKGIGARLMQACLQTAEVEHCDVVWLDVWEHNPRAIAFYRKWGFVEVGWQVFQLGDEVQNDLLMSRSVTHRSV
jgi:GNAT superfamily N-acetyltransferase